MSHQARITPPTKPSSTAIHFSYDYLITIPGILKLAQLILGSITVGCVSPTLGFDGGDLFFVLMATAFMMCTFCLVLASVTSWRNSRLVSETMFEIIYHAVATIFLFVASIVLATVGYRSEAYAVAAVFGSINTCLYFMSATFAYKALVNAKIGDTNSNMDFTTQLLTGNPYYTTQTLNNLKI